MATPIITLVKIALVLVLTTTTVVVVVESFETRSIMTSLKRKETNMVFYMQDWETGSNVTAVPVAGKKGAINSYLLTFGTVMAIDDDITVEMNRSSKQIGRLQGIYVNSALDGSDLHTLVSVVFTEGKYNGSTLEIQGANQAFHKQREIAVVGGTGLFRFAQGYAVLESAFVNLTTLNAAIKFNLTVQHF